MSDKQLIVVFKRLILVGLTIFALFNITVSLIVSWGQPQIQSRLELYQTNLLLHAAQFQDKKTPTTRDKDSTKDLTNAREVLLGKEPFKEAQKQYQEARKEAQKTQAQITAKLDK